MGFKLNNKLDPDIQEAIDDAGLKVLYKDFFTKTVKELRNSNKYEKIEYVMSMIDEMCININVDYVRYYLEETFSESKKEQTKKPDIYDIVIIVNSDMRFYGFMITHVGYCEAPYNKVPTIPIICTRDVSRQSELSTGKLLMYIYVNALKQHKQEYGILELSGTYNNISGYCLYKKFGFDEFMPLRKCYDDTDNLPMLLYTPEIQLESLKK